VYEWLFRHLPGFAGFRMPGRWLLCFPLFLGLLAGMGFQRVADGWKPSRRFLCIGGFAACGLAAAGLWLAAATGAVGAYRWLAKATALRVEALGCPDWLVNLNRSFVARADVDALQVPAQQASGGALLAAALWLALCGASLWLAWRRRRCAPLLALVVTVELFIFAWPLAGRFPSSERQYPEVAAFLQKQKIDDGRVLFVFDGFDNNRNSSITLRAEGLWGWCSLALKRYAEFVAVSQGLDPDKVNMDMPVWRNSRMFQLLRGRYAFVPVKGGGMSVAPLQDARDVLPRFLVVPRHRVLAGRDEILRALSAPDFDFRREVILESDPHLPAPAVKMDNAAPVPEYKIKVLSSSASRWTVEVTASVPGVLLMTDSHAKGWRATALPGSVQREYDLQPADWAVRGIPLTVAGTHFIEIKYTPPGLALGAGITALTLVALLAAALAERVRRRLAQTPRAAGADTAAGGGGTGESL
jgi:hypothetical protein